MLSMKVVKKRACVVCAENNSDELHSASENCREKLITWSIISGAWDAHARLLHSPSIEYHLPCYMKMKRAISEIPANELRKMKRNRPI
jgi:hypothetical protein